MYVWLAWTKCESATRNSVSACVPATGPVCSSGQRVTNGRSAPIAPLSPSIQ